MANEKLTQDQIKQLQLQQFNQNIDFFKYTYVQTQPANQQNGNTYVPGQTRNFTVPVLSGSYLVGVTIQTKLKVTPTKGTGTITLNAAKEHAAIQNIRVNMGSDQINISAYFAKVLAELSGYQKTLPGDVFGGGHKSSSIQDMIYKAPTLNDGVENEWYFETDVPLNSLHPQSTPGVLPMFSNGQPITISVTPASSFTGNDPLDNVLKTTGNAAVSVQGEISVLCTYRDFSSYNDRNQYTLNLAGVPTVQCIKLPEINPLTGNNTYNYMKFQNPYKFARILSVVIDGKSSDKFADAANITGVRMDRQENTSSPFWFHDETNGSIAQFYRKVRETYGQDTQEEGVLPIFDAPSGNQSDPSNRLGENYLNLGQSGFPVSRLGVKINEASQSNGIVPRVVSYGFILNNGIQMG